MVTPMLAAFRAVGGRARRAPAKSVHEIWIQIAIARVGVRTGRLHAVVRALHEARFFRGELLLVALDLGRNTVHKPVGVRFTC